MSLQFCECGSLLEKKTTNDKLKFVCTRCSKTRDTSAVDTLMASSQKTNKGDISNYRVLIQNARHDPTNPRIYRECPRCRHNYLVLIEISEVVLHVCDSCSYYF